jgi:hypothetical protein
MKYLVAVILASICSSSLVYGQARRHYGHEFPIIAGATGKQPIVPSGTSHPPSIQDSRDASWNPSGNPRCNGIVYAIAENRHDGLIVLGGEFDSIDGIQARGLVTTSRDFQDTTLHELGGGCDGVIYAICLIADTDIYVAGNFKHVGTVAANNIAHWNGVSWEALTSGTDSTVLAMTVVGNELFIGGNFRNAGGVPVNFITIWDIKYKSWTSIISHGVIGLDGGVSALANDADGKVYIGGGFLTAGGDTVNKILSMGSPGGWKKLRGGVTGKNAFVSAIGIDENTNLVYVGGSFEKADTVKTANGAIFSPDNGWSASFLQTNGPIYAISPPNGGWLIIGGDFTDVNGEPINHIAANINFLDSFFGSGVDGPVYALSSHIVAVSLRLDFSTILVGGSFQNAGLKPSPFFAVFKSIFGTVKKDGKQVDSFRIYPNPTATEISFENSDRITNLTIVDAIGRTVLTATPNQNNSPVDISTIPNGSYIAIIKANGELYSQQFIIRH